MKPNLVCPHCGCGTLYIVGKVNYTVEFHLTKEPCVKKVTGCCPQQDVAYVPFEGGERVHDVVRELGTSYEYQTVRCANCLRRVGLRRDYEEAGYGIPA